MSEAALRQGVRAKRVHVLDRDKTLCGIVVERPTSLRVVTPLEAPGVLKKLCKTCARLATQRWGAP